MIRLSQEHIALSSASEHHPLVRVHLTRITNEGLDLSTTFVCERRNVTWLANQLDKALNAWEYPRTQASHGADHFTLFRGGSDAAPVVNVRNERASTAPEPGLFTLAMSQLTTAQLRDRFRDLS